MCVESVDRQIIDFVNNFVLTVLGCSDYSEMYENPQIYGPLSGEFTKISKFSYILRKSCSFNADREIPFVFFFNFYENNLFDNIVITTDKFEIKVFKNSFELTVNRIINGQDMKIYINSNQKNYISLENKVNTNYLYTYDSLIEQNNKKFYPSYLHIYYKQMVYFEELMDRIGVLETDLEYDQLEKNSRLFNDYPLHFDKIKNKQKQNKFRAFKKSVTATITKLFN